MPYYDYTCENCGEEFEEYFNIDDDKLNVCCPSCGSKDIIRDFSRVSTNTKGQSKSSERIDNTQRGFVSYG